MPARVMMRNIEAAVEMYYSLPEIGTPEIMKLYGCGRNVALRLKKEAKEEEKKQGKLTFSPYNVNTRCAFQAWNINIDELEKNVLKLYKLKKRKAVNLT